MRFVRAACEPKTALPFLISGLSDTSAIVRENALDELTGILPNELRENVDQMLMDSELSVRQGAKSLLDFEE